MPCLQLSKPAKPRMAQSAEMTVVVETVAVGTAVVEMAVVEMVVDPVLETVTATETVTGSHGAVASEKIAGSFLVDSQS